MPRDAHGVPPKVFGGWRDDRGWRLAVKDGRLEVRLLGRSRQQMDRAGVGDGGG